MLHPLLHAMAAALRGWPSGSEPGSSSSSQEQACESENIAINIAETQVEIVADCWSRAEKGFETLWGAAKNATDLLTVREAMEARDEQEARRLSAM